MNKPKVGDIYRWSWNSKTLKELDCKVRAGTLYWCHSRICVFKEDNKFWDTYWGGSDYQNDKRFSIEAASQKLDLEYIGNFDDLIEARKTERAYYLDEDCVDLNHANSSRGNFYLRKGAKKSVDKMRRIVQRNLLKLQRDADYAQREADRVRKELKSIAENSLVSVLEGVALTDTSYEDELSA